jgi:tetratricopeptide (TPR) repeat protein
MKALNLIIIGLIIIVLSSFTNALTVHNEPVGSTWEFIGSPEEEMKNLTAGHTDCGPFAISENYIIRTVSVYGARHIDESCVAKLDIETHSAGYIYQACTIQAVRTDMVYFTDLFGNKKLDYSPGGPVTTVFISGDYAALGSTNSVVHFFKLDDAGNRVLAWKYAAGSSPGSVYISENSVYAGDNTNIYSINKENGNLNWKYTTSSRVKFIYGTGDGIAAGSDTGIYFIDERGNLIKKQETGEVNALNVDGSSVAACAGTAVYLFDSRGTLKFKYSADDDVSDVKVSESGGYVLAGAGSNVYLLGLNGELKGKFKVNGMINSVNIWGKYFGAGVSGDSSYHYLFNEKEMVDIRYGDEAGKKQPQVKVKSVTDRGDYSIVIHSIIYENNVTNDVFKFYDLGFARAKSLLENARFDISNIEEGLAKEKVEFDLTSAKEHLKNAEKSFEEDDYPESFMNSHLSENEIIDSINSVIRDAEVRINESDNIGLDTRDAEISLVSGENSIVSRDYANAIIYAKNAKEIVSKTVGSVITDSESFFDSIRSVEGFDKVANVPEIKAEIDKANELYSEGKYTEAVELSRNADEMINEGLSRFIEGHIIDAEKKYADAEKIYSQVLQPEEMSIAKTNLDTARQIFNVGKEGHEEEFFKAIDYSFTAGDSADQARTRTIALYLMLAVLLWAVVSALVIMMLKPNWPMPHYPGMEHMFEQHEAEHKKHHDEDEKRKHQKQ